MVVITALFVEAPLVLCALALGCLTAVLVARQSRSARVTLRIGRLVLLVSWLAGLGSALFSGLVRPDWVHDFWGAQIPMVGLFLSSGLLLCGVWGDDETYLLGGSESARTDPCPRKPWRVSPAWVFLGLLLVSCLLPLALQVAFPESHSSFRGTGRPIRNLVELARWGFGEPLPVFLEPFGDRGRARGIDYLPRDVTVPMGTTLIAAWLWIGFCVLAWAGRLVREQRTRIVTYLLAPPALALVVSAFRRGPLALDSSYFGPNPSRDSGIWISDPATMESYGRVLAVAAACTVLLALTLLVRRVLAARRATAGT